MALERGTFGEAVLLNPMVVPLTMARHGLAGHSLGIPFLGVVGSVSLPCLCGQLAVIFSKI